ncbi:hypothetical protein C8Q76DRAFT_799015 [Earliella scabrosa]|nr:hypothetical protein C8Q76DRAFT_799015 [Earliella scabrosa]
MDTPDGHNPNQGPWQDQDGQWQATGPGTQAAAASLEATENPSTEAQGDAPAAPSQPAARQPPRPRHPAWRNQTQQAVPDGQVPPFPGAPPGQPHAPYYPPPHYYHPPPPYPGSYHAGGSQPLPPPPSYYPVPLQPVPPAPSSPSLLQPSVDSTSNVQPNKGKKRASDDDDEPPAKKAKPASKAKAKQTAKGKGKAGEASKSGRQTGSHNYTAADTDTLLDIVERRRPIGQVSWQAVTDEFNQYADENDRPHRTLKPLKTKFEALARTPKPTGTAEVPPHVERAYEIEQLINERIHTRELNDEDIADGDDVMEEGAAEGEDSDVEVLDGPPPSKSKKAATSKGPILKAFTQQPTPGPSTTRTPASMRRGQAAHEFMSAVTTSLDPVARDARDESRFARRLAQDDLNRLTQENRDLRSRNDALLDRLHQQTVQLQQQLTETSRLQTRLEMLELMQSVRGGGGMARGRSRQRDWEYDDTRVTPTRFRSYSRAYRRHRSPVHSPVYGRSSRPLDPLGHDDPFASNYMPGGSGSGRIDPYEHEDAVIHRDRSPSYPIPRYQPRSLSPSSSVPLPGPTSLEPRTATTGLDTLASVASAGGSHTAEHRSDEGMDARHLERQDDDALYRRYQ